MVGQLVIETCCRGDEVFMGTEFSWNGRTLGGAIAGRFEGDALCDHLLLLSSWGMMMMTHTRTQTSS